MSNVSKEEFKAYLITVEAQMRESLRISASESKFIQQSHNTLRADLSTSLVRYQSDINLNNEKLSNKLDKLLLDVDDLGKQRKLIVAVIGIVILLLGLSVGMLLAVVLFNFDISIYENILSIFDHSSTKNIINN